MNEMRFRTRIAVLWVAVAVAAAAQMVLYLLIPGALEEMLAGQIEGEALTEGVGYQMAALVAVPVVMAVVALLARERVARLASLVVGMLVGLFGTFLVADHLVDGVVNGHVLLAAMATLLSLLIAGLCAAELRRSAPGHRGTPGSPTERQEPTTV